MKFIQIGEKERYFDVVTSIYCHNIGAGKRRVMPRGNADVRFSFPRISPHGTRVGLCLKYPRDDGISADSVANAETQSAQRRAGIRKRLSISLTWERMRGTG